MACGTAILLAVASLAACDPAGKNAPAAGPTGEETQTATTAGSDGGGVTAEPQSGTASGHPGGGAAGALSLPLLQLQEVVEKHGQVSFDGETGPGHLPAAALNDTAVAAFGASSAECAGEVSSDHPMPCVIHDAGGEGSVDGQTFMAYLVRGSGQGADGVLFVQGTQGLTADLERIVTHPDSTLSGLEQGVGYVLEDRDPATVADDVRATLSSPQAKLAWGLDSIDALTCSSGLTARAFRPAHCSMDFGGGLPAEVTVLPANWVGAGAEPGPLVIVNGTA